MIKSSQYKKNDQNHKIWRRNKKFNNMNNNNKSIQHCTNNKSKNNLDLNIKKQFQTVIDAKHKIS